MGKVLNVVLNVVLWVIIIIAAFFTVVTLSAKSDAGVAYLGGYAPMTVLTDSMKGEFNKGDLIIVKQTDARTLQEGDVIAFWTLIENRRSINTHRIIEVMPSDVFYQYVTKGDANPIEDRVVVSEGDLIGKYVMKVPVMGKVMGVLSSSIGFLLILVLPLLLFFIWQLYKLIVLIIQIKKEAVIEATENSRALIEEEIRRKMEAEGMVSANAPPAPPQADAPAAEQAEQLQQQPPEARTTVQADASAPEPPPAQTEQSAPMTAEQLAALQQQLAAAQAALAAQAAAQQPAAGAQVTEQPSNVVPLQPAAEKKAEKKSGEKAE